MIPYNSLTKLINDKGTDFVVNEIYERLKDTEFPYKKLYIKTTKEEFFDNILKFTPEIKIEQHTIKNINDPSGEFRKNFWLSFRGQQMIITTSLQNYHNINVFSDFFAEKARMSCIGFGQTMSPINFWKDRRKTLIRTLLNSRQDVTLENFRELIYKQVKECRSGKITTYLTLFRYFQPVHVLDPSSAWGDRLIAALSSPSVKYYNGTDPNPDLRRTYKQIMEEVFPLIPKEYEKIKKNFVTNINGFEDVNLPENIFYDLVYISPPPFIGEIYGESPKQATNRYQTFESYLINFLVPYVSKAASYVVNGGWFMITVLDRPETKSSKSYSIVEILLHVIEIFCENIHYSGSISWQGDSGSLTPIFIFRKKKYDGTRQIYRIKQALNLIRENYPIEIYNTFETIMRKKTGYFDRVPEITCPIHIGSKDYTIRELVDEIKKSENLPKLLDEMKKSGMKDFIRFNERNDKQLRNNMIELAYDFALSMWRNSIS
jgi:hypothetical protein